MNIYEKMSAITAELTAVAKNLSVGEGRSSYKAVGEADVLAAVRPLEVKHKVYSYPVDREVVSAQIMESEKEYKGQVTKTQKQFMRVRTTYRFVNMEKPDEYIDMVTYGDGVDPQDKAPGKAMTYSDKYALLKAYKIITGEDPDQYKSEEGRFYSQLASERERETLFRLCNSDKAKYESLLRSVGCADKKQLTVEQHAKALDIIKESANGNNGKAGAH